MTPMKLKIDVTADDIQNGVRKSSTQCPIARAVDRAVKECGASYSVEVDSKISLYNSPEDQWKQNDWLDMVYQWIIDYDRGLEVKPFTKEIEFLPTF